MSKFYDFKNIKINFFKLIRQTAELLQIESGIMIDEEIPSLFREQIIKRYNKIYLITFL